MQKIILLFLIFNLSFLFLKAQNVAINTDGSPANTSAILDVKSSTKGMLVPRLNAAQRIAIASPSNGLLIYDTDSLAFSYFDGIIWKFLKGQLNNSTNWSTTGNASTTSDNFIGTTDAQALRFKVKNGSAGIIDSTNSLTSLGVGALRNNTSGLHNIAMGSGALFKNTIGNNSVAIGDSALFNQKFGFFGQFENTAIGVKSLFNNVQGSQNTAIGAFALDSNYNGHNNSAVGFSSLSNNKSGVSNTAVGTYSLVSNLIGHNNTAVGYVALNDNDTGSNNTAVGMYALSSNKKGSYNTSIGGYASANTSNTNYNTAVGYESNYYGTGDNNTYVGASSGYGNFLSIGYLNTAIGKKTMYKIQSGHQNIAMGDNALYADTSGSLNVALGAGSLESNLSGNNNVASGFWAARLNKIGHNAISIGYSAAYSNIAASNNIAIGESSLYNNGAGSSTGFTGNTAVGSNALNADVSGFNNTAIGFEASKNTNTAGNAYNTALGASAQLNTNGSYNTLIGSFAYVSNTFNNWTAIGYNCGAGYSTSNSVELGNSSVTLVRGQVNYSTFSDKRIKDNIQENVPGLAFITKLKPVTYNLNIHRQNEMMYGKEKPDTTNWAGKYDIEKIKMSGFIAQDVEAAATNISYNFSGVQKPTNNKGLYSLCYAEFVVPLVKATQELNIKLENVDKENQLLKKELEEIKKLLNKKL